MIFLSLKLNLKLRYGETNEFIEVVESRMNFLEKLKGKKFSDEKNLLVGLYLDITSEHCISNFDRNGEENDLISRQETVKKIFFLA